MKIVQIVNDGTKVKVREQIAIAVNLCAIVLCVASIVEVEQRAERRQINELSLGHAAAVERIAYLETILEARGIVVDAEEARSGLTIVGDEKEQE